MVTLKQLVNEQKWNDMTDIQIIKPFFDLNDMEEEGMELIYESSKSKEDNEIYFKGEEQ